MLVDIGMAADVSNDLRNPLENNDIRSLLNWTKQC